MKHYVPTLSDEERELLNTTLILPEVVLWRFNPPQMPTDDLLGDIAWMLAVSGVCIAVCLVLVAVSLLF